MRGMGRRQVLAGALLLALCLLSIIGEASCSAGKSPVGSGKGRGDGKDSKKSAVRKYLADKGLSPSDIPAALVLYEVMSMTLMLTTLGLVLVIQPAQQELLAQLGRIMPSKQGGALSRLSAKFSEVQLRARDKCQCLAQTLKIDPVTFATAYAECACIRIALKPVLVPFKLFLVWKVLTAIKSWWGRDESKRK